MRGQDALRRRRSCPTCTSAARRRRTRRARPGRPASCAGEPGLVARRRPRRRRSSRPARERGRGRPRTRGRRSGRRGRASATIARELGRREPPVQRHGDRADLARREQQLDDLGRGPVEVRDARARPHAGGEQRLREPVRALVELARRSARARRGGARPRRRARRPRARGRRRRRAARRRAAGRLTLRPPRRAPRGTRAIASSTAGSSVGYRWPDSSRIRSRAPGMRSASMRRSRPGSRGRGAVHDERRDGDPRQPPVAVVQSPPRRAARGRRGR